MDIMIQDHNRRLIIFSQSSMRDSEGLSNDISMGSSNILVVENLLYYYGHGQVVDVAQHLAHDWLLYTNRHSQMTPPLPI